MLTGRQNALLDPEMPLESNRIVLHPSSISDPGGRGVQFGLGTVLPHSDTPARNASRSDAGGPSLRAAGFEDSNSTELVEVLPDVASQLVRHSFPEFRTTERRREFQTTGRSREDEDEVPFWLSSPLPNIERTF